MNQNTSQAAQAIIGAWRLISFEIERDDGTVIRPFGNESCEPLAFPNPVEQAHAPDELRPQVVRWP